MDLSNIDNWMSGVYHHNTGLYTENAGRIALKKYVFGDGGEGYTIGISNGKYNVLVRELDTQKKVLASHNLTDGASFTAKNSTVYFAISVYCPSNSSLTFEDYEALFGGGMSIAIHMEGETLEYSEQDIVKDSEQDITQDVTQDIAHDNGQDDVAIVLPVTSTVDTCNCL